MGLKKLYRIDFVVACALGMTALGGARLAGQAAPATTLVEPPVPLLLRVVGDLTALSGSNAGTAADASGQTFEGASCLPRTLEDPPEARPSDEWPRCQAVWKEAGLSRWHASDYTHANGSGKIQVSALEFGDATGAYSAYSFLRSDSAEPGGKVERISSGEMTVKRGSTLVWSGTCVLYVEGQTSAEELDAFTLGLPKVGGRKGLAPLLPTLLPKGETQTAAARYALGPLSYQVMGGVLPAADLGWDKSLEVITVPTAGKAGRGTLTLLLYPTPQIAGDRGRAVEKMVNEPGNHYGMVKLRRVGPLVAMASGSMTGEQAHALVEGIKLNEEVSFDQKMPLEFHAEVRKTASLLQNIAVLCGVLILAALLLGLFLGGARAGVRVLMGKPAASEPEFLTINLRGPSMTAKDLGDGGQGKRPDR